jgi:hypothetical protein
MCALTAPVPPPDDELLEEDDELLEEDDELLEEDDDDDDEDEEDEPPPPQLAKSTSSRRQGEKRKKVPIRICHPVRPAGRSSARDQPIRTPAPSGGNVLRSRACLRTPTTPGPGRLL